MAGIRPEHFEDAALVDDQPGATFEVKVEILESMGSELYAYFDVEADAGPGRAARRARRRHRGRGGRRRGRLQIVARLDADSEAKEGEKIEMWLDPERLHFFDVDSGDRITGGDGEASGRPPPRLPVEPLAQAGDHSSPHSWVRSSM